MAQPAVRTNHVRKDVNGAPSACHLELTGNGAQLLDRVSSAGISRSDEDDEFAVPLDRDPVHRVLEHRRAAMLALGSMKDKGRWRREAAARS
jgi:hypothetical protein